MKKPIYTLLLVSIGKQEGQKAWGKPTPSKHLSPKSALNAMFICNAEEQGGPSKGTCLESVPETSRVQGGAAASLPSAFLF